MAASAARRSADDTSGVTRVTKTRIVHHHQLLTPDIIESADWHCYSAPQSREGSFKKHRRTGLADAAPRSSLPSLEDSITAKLLELQQLEADDCRVVREFVTSERGGIVARGDSFRRNRETTSDNGKTTKTQTKTDRQGQSAGAAAIPASGGVSAEQIVAEAVACKVVIMGDRGVGKTALLQQLMTSHYMAAMNTGSFGQSHTTVLTTLCPNNVHLFIFQITFSKSNRFQ